MKLSNAEQVALVFALIGGVAVSEATKERITVKNHGINFKVDWWDDGRINPYQVSFTKNDVPSEYTFDAAGRLKLVYVDGDGYQFTMFLKAGGDALAVQSLAGPVDRMLLSMQEEMEVDEMEIDHRRRLYDCSDCERTWDAMCDVGLEDVCYWVGLETDLFSEDTQISIKKMCKKFTKECTVSAEAICEEICTEGGFGFP